MIHRRLAGALGFAAALGAATWATAQETPGGGGPRGGGAPPRYDLRAAYPFRVGDRVRVVQGTKHEALCNVLQRGKPLRVENRRGGFELRYVDEVLELSRGQPVRIKRSYERVKDWGTGVEDRRRRDVVLDYSGETMAFQAQEDLPEVARELLESSSKVPLSAYEHLIPPDGPVPVGHRWKIANAPAAQIFRLDPEAIVEEGSACGGQLAATRMLGQVEQTQVVLTFRLRFQRMFDITFDAPAELECTMDLWEAARGGAPTSTATTRGSLVAEGRVPSAPKDVTIKMEMTVSGTYQRELLGTAR